jgi:hypothetical protein
MNERIRELADEAGFMDSWFSESGDDCERELKKFAELIVQKCADIGALKADGNYEVYNSIVEYFGMQESEE